MTSRQKGVVVYTAIIGSETDSLRAPVVVDPRARYLCFSDQPVDVPPYEWIAVPSATNPRLASRSYKVLASHPLLAEARYLLWHDASYRLTRDVRWVRDCLRGCVDLFAFRHARQTRTIEIEALRLVQYGYLTQETADAHIQRYRDAGFDRDDAITCGGLLARRRSVRMNKFNTRWWDEVQQWGGRDQASLDYVAWRSGIVLGHLEGQIKANEYAQFRNVDVVAVSA